MKRSNLIPITRIYDIYPKYTYSDDVKKFMDEIVDIDRANVYTKADMVAILTELKTEIEALKTPSLWQNRDYYMDGTSDCFDIIQQKIDVLIKG